MRLLLLYVALHLADVVTTYVGLQHGAREGSSLYADLFAHLPFALVVGIKLTFAAVLAAYVLLVQYRWWRLAALVEMGVLCGFMGIVVASNVWVLISIVAQ